MTIYILLLLLLLLLLIIIIIIIIIIIVIIIITQKSFINCKEFHWKFCMMKSASNRYPAKFFFVSFMFSLRIF
jgi:hypothetical protein